MHLYGKAERPGRKIGHVTVRGDDLDEVRRRARLAADYLATGVWSDGWTSTMTDGGQRVSTPPVGVVMGSDSDWPMMRAAAEALDEFDVAYEVARASRRTAPRGGCSTTPARPPAAALRVVIAGAGGAAHLPGMVASATRAAGDRRARAARSTSTAWTRCSRSCRCRPGVPVATVSIGGARNAGLLAVRILGASDPELARAMERFQAELAEIVATKDAALAARAHGEAQGESSGSVR